VTEREIAYVTDAAANDWYGRGGEYLRRFERAFADSIGVKHAIGVPHCTAALHLSFLALNLGKGDEVIVPDTTWTATAAPLFYVGAVPVFADIDRTTWCVTPESVAACITPRTRAIMVVDLYGSLPDMPAIRAIAEAHGLPIIEDAAQSIGALLNGRPAGSFGDISTYSFHGTKTVTTGEGGMVVTDRTDLYEKAAYLRDHCRTPEGFRFFITNEIGYKYKMSGLQAAFGLGQLERLPELIERKRTIFGWYRDRLKDLPGITLNAEPPGLTNTYWMVTVVVDERYDLTTRAMMDAFDRCSIDTRPFFPPLSSLPAFAGVPDAAAARTRNVVAYDLATRAVNLPSALLLEESDVDRVCTAFRQMLRDRPNLSGESR
jgi:perosamine synthetase